MEQKPSLSLPQKIKTEDGYIFILQPDKKTYVAGGDLTIEAEDLMEANSDPNSLMPKWEAIS